VRIALAGLVSGAVIPYVFLLLLDMSWVVLALWGQRLGTATLGALQERPTSGSFDLALTHGLSIVFTHVWRIRWVGIAMGGVGMLAAMVGDCVARAGQSTRGATFLTILAPSIFVTNAAAMLFQERLSALAAPERLVLVGGQLAKSHWGILTAGTGVAFLLAVVIWELWQIAYAQLAYLFRLPPPGSAARRGSSSSGLTRAPTEERQIRQDRIHHVVPEAARPYSSPSDVQTVSVATVSSPGRWWAAVPPLVIGLVLWIPLQRAYLGLVPTVTSEIAYLTPDQPMNLASLIVGPEPKVITFSSSTGQGTVDLQLEDGHGTALREVRNFRLMDLPGIAYNTATMSMADVSPGTYTLRLTLRPTEEEIAAEDVPGRSGGSISWSLLQGGGRLFRVLAFLMAGLTTLIIISGCILLTHAGNWFRGRYS